MGSLTELSNNDVMSFIEYSPPSSNKLLTFCWYSIIFAAAFFPASTPGWSYAFIFTNSA